MSTKSRNIQNTSDQGSTTTRKVASVAHDAIESAVDRAEPVEQKLRDQANKAGDQIEATQHAAAEQVQQSMKKVESFVREKPVAATGIAFTAGIVVALLLRR
jgi:ElaB/YqjD/DUF883 family membrane-anchored ribosome-binding protein